MSSKAAKQSKRAKRGTDTPYRSPQPPFPPKPSPSPMLIRKAALVLAILVALAAPSNADAATGVSGGSTIVSTDANGNPYTIAYDSVNLMFTRATFFPIMVNAAQFKLMLNTMFGSTTADTAVLRDAFSNSTTCTFDGTNVTCTENVNGLNQFKYTKSELLTIIGVLGI